MLIGSNWKDLFDLGGNLIEDYNESKTRKRDVMGDDFEDRWRKTEKISRFSKSSSTSRQADISSDSVEETSYQSDVCDSCLAKMGQRNSAFHAKPNWSAHAGWSYPSKEESASSVFPP